MHLFKNIKVNNNSLSALASEKEKENATINRYCL